MLAQLRRWLRDPRHQLRLAVASWLLPLLIISVLVVQAPERRSVLPGYHAAISDWQARRSLYYDANGRDGSYHYPPQFVAVFAPFHALPMPLGDVLWRWLNGGLLVWALWRWTRDLAGVAAPRWFLLASLVALPVSLPAMHNGQANVLIGALLLLAASALVRRQWWGAVLCLLVALAVKQLVLAMILLAVVGYPRLWWRLALGLVALALLPFALGPTAYVMTQYHESITHLLACAANPENRFADLNGIVRACGGNLQATFHLALPGHSLNLALATVLSAAAGLVTLAVWWLGARRLGPAWRGLWLFTLTAGYLMLFNPMTEANSYVIVAPAFGLWAAWSLSASATVRKGWVIAAMGFSMGLLPNLLWPLFGPAFALVWFPALTFVFLVLVARTVWRDRLPAASAIA